MDLGLIFAIGSYILSRWVSEIPKNIKRVLKTHGKWTKTEFMADLYDKNRACLIQIKEVNLSISVKCVTNHSEYY